MKRIIGEHFTLSGKPKKPYEDKTDARLAAMEEGKHFYKCKFCGSWHIGGKA